MAVFSTLLRSVGRKILQVNVSCGKKVTNVSGAVVPARLSSQGTFVVEPSRWQWHKTKDYFHFYTLVAAIPLTIFTFWAYVFVGPATLEPIPEDYTPKYWEYYRNPITRWMARYCYVSPQQDYEKNMHALYVEQELVKIRKLTTRIENLMDERQDYQARIYRPFNPRPYQDYTRRLADSSTGLQSD